MKKLFLGLSAIAMLFATSCQNDADFGTIVEETATVSFKVETPEIATRAYSDGTTATHLQYAVYDADGNELTDLTVTNGEIHGSTSVNLQLTTGNTYSVIFWAAAPNAPYSVDFATKQMTINYNGVASNDENLDAFYKHHTFTVRGAQTETIELRRPFAQLNIGTNDYVASENAGYLPTQSAVTVRNIYNTLNLVDGTVENEVEVAFAAADIDRTEEFPVAGYEYLAMNYLLVAADKALVDVDFIYTNGTDAKTRTIGSVPVQRNHRTNLYGNVLTSNVEINVEIKPEYDEPSLTAVALYQAAAFGGEVTLSEDVVLTSSLIIQANATINLNGYSIKGGKEYVNGMSGSDISAITVDNGASLVIDGEGSIEGTQYGIYVKEGTLTVKAADVKAITSAVQVYRGTANLEGGIYSNSSSDKRYTINCIDSAWKSGNAKVNISGGRYYMFNPENNAAEGAGTNFLVEKRSVAVDGDWYVVTEGAVTVDNAVDFESAVETSTASKVIVTEDITIDGAFTLENRGALTIDMGENSLKGGDYVGNVLYATQLTMENGEFAGGFQTVYDGAKLIFNGGKINVTSTSTSGRYCFYVNNNAEVVINGGEFSFAKKDGKRSYIYAANGATVYVKGGVFGKPSTHKDYKNDPIKLGTGGEVIISGGTFGFNPESWLATGYKAEYNDTDKTWTVVAE